MRAVKKILRSTIVTVILVLGIAMINAIIFKGKINDACICICSSIGGLLSSIFFGPRPEDFEI
jgi:hypothetical protein